MQRSERLTYKTQGDATRGSHYCTGPGIKKDDVVQRLGAYEDTGLSPEEIVPVKRGHWIQVDDTKCRCSECDVITLIAQYPHGEKNYCPNCGAKMGGGEY